MNNKNVLLFMALLVSVFACADECLENMPKELQVEVTAKKTKKVAIGIILLGCVDQNLKKCIQTVTKDLEWSGQCQIIGKEKAELKQVKDLQQMFDPSITVAVIISKSGCVYTWRLYDIPSAAMVAGSSVDQQKITTTMVGHTIADQLWPKLFGQLSSFRSKIAYSKQIWRIKHGKEKPYKQIWIADFDGSNAQLFIDAPTVSFAPRWNNAANYPLLFYSENTMSNVQLVMSNMFGKRKVICSFDGLNMQPTFSDDGKKVVFCVSKDGSSQLYLSYIDLISHERKFDRLTFNSGSNIAPCFIDNGHVAFVSDFKTNKPQIYMLDLKTKTVQSITDGGYCACPSYSAVKKQLVYSKMLGHGMQLFTYDFATGEHKQLTIGPGSKEEGSWSACGNYIVFGMYLNGSSQVAQLYVPTGQIKYLTSSSDNCTYPDCSPLYDDYIGILCR